MAEEDKGLVAAFEGGVAGVLDGLPLGAFTGDEDLDVRAFEGGDLGSSPPAPGR